jgi:glutamate/tyrosine decarboxylase-like PLP-dependent enzyme
MRTLFFTDADRKVRHAGEIMKITDSWPSDSVFASFEAVAQTDSITIHPHKLGYIPYLCSAILFRQEEVRELISFDAPVIVREAEQRRTPFVGRYILEARSPGLRQRRADSRIG